MGSLVPFLLIALIGLGVVVARWRVAARHRPLVRILGGAGLLALVLLGGHGTSLYPTLLGAFGVLFVALGLAEARAMRRRAA